MKLQHKKKGGGEGGGDREGKILLYRRITANTALMKESKKSRSIYHDSDKNYQWKLKLM